MTVYRALLPLLRFPLRLIVSVSNSLGYSDMFVVAVVYALDIVAVGALLDLPPTDCNHRVAVVDAAVGVAVAVADDDVVAVVAYSLNVFGLVFQNHHPYHLHWRHPRNVIGSLEALQWSLRQ